MKDYYAQFAAWRVFSHKQVVEYCGNTKTAESVLYAYKKKGRIQQVTRGLYAAVSLETGESIASVYEIAGHITTDSYISHHTAFTYYGLANQVSYTITVSSAVRFKPFEYDGYRFQYRQSKTSAGVIKRHGVRITDVERTIIDSIRDFIKTAGLEELLRCLEMITLVREDQLTSYLEVYSSIFLYQKAGYILSHFKEQMKLSDRFFENCHAHIGKSVRYLYPEIRREQPVYHKKWQLYAPEDLMAIIDKGGSEIV